MSTATTATLTFSCPVATDALTPIRSGHYCQSCEKHVRDYTTMSDRELLMALRQNPSGCGSFRADQLDRNLDTDLARAELTRRGYTFAAIALLLALQILGVQKANAQEYSRAIPPGQIEVQHAVSTDAKTYSPTSEQMHSFQIVDQTGEPLAGATVAALATDGTILAGEYADESGSVTLLISDAVDRVQVSFVGYRTEEFLLSSQLEPVLEMGTLETMLNEVVVTSYHSEATRDVLGGYSITSCEYGYGEVVDSTASGSLDFESEVALEWAVFPNPSTGLSTLRLPTMNALVNVYSVTGQLVLSLAPDAFATQVELELPARLPSGTYVVEVVGSNGFAEAVKWVVMR